MKKCTSLLLAIYGLTLSAGLAQNPPPVPPSQNIPPPPPRAPSTEQPPRPADKDRSAVFLGIEASRLPSALSDQLDLPAGFGLLVDYVVPGSAAEAAGVKKHDILKMLNDQILTSEEQLSVLVRSFSDGQEVTLVVLRKGQENKLTAKLQKRAPHSGHPGGRNAGAREDGASDFSENDFHFDFDEAANRDVAERIHDSLERSRERAEEAAARANEQVQRALETVRERAARSSASRLDLDDAQIMVSDSTGRLQIHSSHGKRTLTIRDADGKKVFDGPIDTPEQRKAIPADALPRVEALEREQVVTFPKRTGNGENEAND